MNRITHPKRKSRGSFALALLASLILSAMLLAPAVAAPVEPADLGEVPTTGGLRPGPVGLQPPAKKGVKPVSIQIENAQVNSQVETQEIVDGVMQNPSGPFIVSWYKETGSLGEDDNVVMAGHLDYWDVGEAVFYHLGDLKEKDIIEVTGENNVVYRYSVDWVKNYTVDELDEKGVQQIVGNTSSEKLTLITCGGPFDYEKGEYLQRMVVRASVTE